MFQRLFLTVSLLLTVASLNGMTLRKKYNSARTDIPISCGDGSVKCRHKNVCIPQRWVCDGDNDCGDDSDESDCPPVTCSEYERECPTRNRCKPIGSFCDGVNDCGDNSDEPEDCRSRNCPEGQLKCNSGPCIPANGYCYGENFCLDDTQFTNITCPPITCDPGFVKCVVKSKCIWASFVCDGFHSCGDVTDGPDYCRSRTCPEGQLKCNSGQCIPANDYCIGQFYCSDGTQFTDITCPPITCDPGYVKCAVKSQCIWSSSVCDGINNCGDMSDEPDNCRNRSCEPGLIRCNNGQCLHQEDLCSIEFGDGCKDNTDIDLLSICSNFTCPEGYSKCVSDGKCIRNDWLCNGYSHCADSSDEDPIRCMAPIECTRPGTAPCLRARLCINSRYICDTDNDCGDLSDEDESFCSTRTCQPNEVRCGNGQCLDKEGFCGGSYSCRDGSFTNRSTICPNEGNAPPSSGSNSNNDSSAKEVSCFRALHGVKRTCADPFPELSEAPFKEKAFLMKLAEVDIQVLCGPIRTYFGCFKRTLSVCANVDNDNQMLAEVKLIMSVGDSAINYVCVQHYEVFNRNKTCLLEEVEQAPDTHSTGLKLFDTINACARESRGSPSIDRRSRCYFFALRHCFEESVAAQCGDAFTSAFRGLVDLVQSAAGCPIRSLRALPYVQEQHQAFRHLESGAKDEFSCLLAIIHIRDICSMNYNYESDPMIVYVQMVENDVRESCRYLQEGAECAQRAFDGCENVSHPLVANLNRMFSIARITLNYICVEHVNVISRNRECLQRKTSTGPLIAGWYREPDIILAMEPCTELIQPESVGSGDRLCWEYPAAERCARDVVAAQCGQEIATIISGLNDAIRFAANCPARRMVVHRSAKIAPKSRVPFTCGPGFTKCAGEVKCIPSSFVCDGQMDCATTSDEPFNCRDRLCEPDFFKCNNGQCLNRTEFCLSYGSYGCTDDTDVSNTCSEFTCPAGYTKCVSDGRCVAKTTLCDGSPDCADDSDEAPHHCTAPLQCKKPGTALCPGARRCINTKYFCDMSNDCGDNSDEDELFCMTRTCQPNEVRCENGQCIDKDFFCFTSYNCRDRSIFDKRPFCRYSINGRA